MVGMPSESRVTDDRLGESCNLEGAVYLRQGGAHRAIKPDVEGEKDDQRQH